MREHLDYCDVHGDFILIKDSVVPKNIYDINRARKTIPKGWLTIKKSKISGEGVWSLREIPEGIRFGPYEGEILNCSNDEGYCWEVSIYKFIILKVFKEKYQKE